MEYNLSIEELNRRYKNIFKDELTDMEQSWKELHRKIEGTCGAIDIPDDISDILTADYPELVDMFLIYKSTKIPEAIEKEIKVLFNYKKYQPKISGFFMDPENKFEIHVCHYCGMAYINAYGIKSYYWDKYDFIKNARSDELKKFIPGNLSDKTIKKIIDNRDSFNCIDDFDSLSCWHSKKKSESINLLSDKHFDLDHELDKGSCPLLALSLYNFVPCCPICNEKLKHSATIGSRTDREELIKLSPTSAKYDFDNSVTFCVTPRTASTLRFLKTPKEYRIDMIYHDDSFKKSVNLFRLKQRYNYHKVFALRLLDLKERYSTGSIKMISNLLQGTESTRYTEQQIYEDIFGEEYSRVGHRCFNKLKMDILK